MNTIKIGKADLDKNNRYIGKQEFSDWSNPVDAHLEIDENLGYVSFEKSLVVKGSIIAKAGSGIKAGEGIKAGWGIEAGSGIEAGWGIEADWGIKAGEGIKADWGIKAGEGIKAGSGIKAGEGIEAGSGIKAGSGIVSLYGFVKAMLKISIHAKCTIAAGVFSTDGAREVEAQEIDGNVSYGTVKLLPKPKEEVKEVSLSGKLVVVEVDGKKYEAVIK